MNRQVLDILNQQEQAEQSAYQSETLLLNMIRQDFADSERLLRLFNTVGAGIVQLFQFPDFPALVRETVVPIRTSNAFSIHKHTLCQIPYFHTHDFYELVYVLRGNCKQEFEHLPAPLVLREKQACLLRPGIVHSISKCGSSDVILKFTIPEALFAKAAQNVVGNELDTGICIFQASTTQVDFLVYMLLQENFYRNVFWDSAMEHYLSLLFVELARGPEYRSSALLFQLAEYFDADPCSATLSGFASFVGYSEHYTARLVKRHTGRSFLEVIVSLKMERAGKLLSESDASIADIAENLGYANASGLHKQFFAAYGMTPSAYRKLFEQGNGPLRK